MIVRSSIVSLAVPKSGCFSFGNAALSSDDKKSNNMKISIKLQRHINADAQASAGIRPKKSPANRPAAAMAGPDTRPMPTKT
eukprot:CAMPEP_0197349138 /NCGR_PEP_ID=MMETSP0893-20130614/9245_1 /TAXON_ID=44058 ORGANISM="Aureoumbra lagunensis, Strain CCMP1510" /NCGR_SAMPLE_ID=MMETSP0893 /ASSEMBLY_ACC=CAM_ASM_000539 /LENGTH=81 /DNA_ID=CAMNT_0042860197 /DNA_START=1479 /DNA_END=1724 /DNA_ORIENTATION=-